MPDGKHAVEPTDLKAEERFTGFWLQMSVWKEFFFVTNYKTENKSG